MRHIPLARHPYTKWTAKREHDLTKMWNDGVRVAVIADALGVTPKAVYKKVWTLRVQHGRGADVPRRAPGRPQKGESRLC